MIKDSPSTDKIAGLTREQLEGSRVIRAFGRIKAGRGEFSKTNQDYTDWQELKQVIFQP